MKQLSNTEAELKKSVAYIKNVCYSGVRARHFFSFFFDLAKSLICICIKQPFPRYLLETLKNQLRKYKKRTDRVFLILQFLNRKTSFINYSW